MYYAASIYEMVGFNETESIWLSGFTALGQVVGLIVSIFLVEKLGRRTLVLWSLSLVTLSLFGLVYRSSLPESQANLSRSPMICVQVKLRQFGQERPSIAMIAYRL